MNKLTALAFTMALSLAGASTTFASNMNDQVPQVQNLNSQEMISAVGAGQIYWSISTSGTQVFQADSNSHPPHQATLPSGQWYNIGGHNINAGQFIQVWCRGNVFRQGQFNMPNYSIGLRC
ncbi:MAG: hypothetical protein L3K25_00135 [Gammaproteobacteria bacterium]|nr:hypothetical protein [Gammaproteobacteria bacterium]